MEAAGKRYIVHGSRSTEIKLWCIADIHCRYRMNEVCSLRGECVDDLAATCWAPPGDKCVGTFVESVCSLDKRCHPSCNTHADCDGTPCWCHPPEWFQPSTFSAGSCGESRCDISGTCLPGYEPVPGTLECAPMLLEGDCHRAYDCPPGYEQTGTEGCTMVQPFAWREPDAGVP